MENVVYRYMNNSWQALENGRFVVSGGSKDEARRNYEEIVEERKHLSNDVA